MLDDTLVSGVVGWLISAVGTALSRRSADAVLGSSEERALRSALADSVSAIVAQVPEDAREDLTTALRERVAIPPLDAISGDGPGEIFANLIDGLLAPLALPGQTLANHRIDAAWLSQTMLDALMTAIRRIAVTSGALADLAQLIGIERLEIAQRRLEQVIADRPDAMRPVNNLPRSVLHFTGRDHILRQLCALARREEADVAIAVQAVEGMAGIGKTELVIRAAHLLTGDYPDAQLYLDLQGFTLGMVPIPPDKALESLLIAVGVPPEQMPLNLDQRAALWRSRLSGRRSILVLDNASDASQVAPLIPGTSGCLVLITSRRSMANLEDVELIRLDVLEEGAATELFTRVLEESIVVDLAHAQRIVRLCGFLPLAVRLAAGRLRRRPRLGAENLARELADIRGRLASLRNGDREVRAAFEVSYRALEPGLQVAFRRLGLHPGPDISPEAAAALIDVAPTDAERQLEELLTQSLLQETTMSRFVLHDLIREYANERVHAEEDEDECLAAERRLMALFLRKAISVNQELSEAAKFSEGLAGAVWARHWLESERANVVAVARLAEENTDRFAVDLARILGTHLMNLGFMDDAKFVFSAASHVGRRLADQEADALGLLGLGEVLRFTGRYADARNNLIRAYAISSEIGNRRMAADALYSLGEIERASGDYSKARENYDSSQRICAEIGEHRGQANALRGMAEIAQALEDLDGARNSYMRSHTLSVDGADRQGQAFALLGLGEVERTAGSFATSRVHYEVARTLCLDIGDRRGQANASYGLGEVARTTGDHATAHRHFADAHAITVEIGNRRGQAYTLLGMGDSERASGDNASAALHLQEAQAICQEIGDRLGEARALVGLGDIAENERNPTGAVAYWREAREILQSAGLMQRSEEIGRRIERYRTQGG
jgi:tetratricopeptide (TPR) repeat protein